MTLVAVICVALGLPLALGLVPPNVWYGFRTRLTLHNRPAWDAANRAAGWSFAATGVAVYIASQGSRPAAVATLFGGIAVSAALGFWRSHAAKTGAAPIQTSSSVERSLFHTSVMISVLLIALALPLLLNQIPPNGWYGFRTAQSLSSESAWYRANQLAGAYLTASGVLSLWVVPRLRDRRHVPLIPAGAALFACLLAAVHFYLF